MADFINGMLELGGAAFMTMDVRQILRDREVRGVYWPARGFFAVWGLWNLYYYPSLGQWWSTVAGASLVTVNIVWLVLVWRFLRDSKHVYDTTVTK
jgi:hypothetical protein